MTQLANSSLTEAASQSAVCRKCACPNEGYTVCRVCGYYAKLDQFVEIDQVMEGLIDEEEVPFRLPRWVYLLIAINCAVIAESVCIAVLMPTNSIERLIWSVAHLGVGIMLLALFQVQGTLLAIADDLSVSIIDCLAWPPKAWEAIAARLPGSSYQFTMASVGATSILMSLLVIRSIPFSSLLQSDEPPPKYESLLATAVKHARVVKASKQETEMTMEDALESFAEDAASKVTEMSEDEELSEDDPAAQLKAIIEQELEAARNELEERVRQQVRCIVIGYLPSEVPDSLAGLVVATASRFENSKSKFEVLGVVPVTNEDFQEKMLHHLRATVRPTPFVHTELQAIWVDPQIRCEVSFEEQGESRHPVSLKIEKLY